MMASFGSRTALPGPVAQPALAGPGRAATAAEAAKTPARNSPRVEVAWREAAMVARTAQDGRARQKTICETTRVTTAMGHELRGEKFSSSFHRFFSHPTPPRPSPVSPYKHTYIQSFSNGCGGHSLEKDARLMMVAGAKAATVLARARTETTVNFIVDNKVEDRKLGEGVFAATSIKNNAIGGVCWITNCKQ